MCDTRQVIYEVIEPCTPPEYSFIRGFHSLAEFPPVDVYVNAMLRAKNFKYKDMTPYMPSSFGPYDIQVFLTGTKDKPLVDIKNLQIPTGQIITFAILGSSKELKLLPIIDDINETIMRDETKIRFYNLNGPNIAFTMSMPNGSISSSLNSGNGTGYYKVNHGKHVFEVRSSSQNVKPIITGIDLKPGIIYTLYITGSIDPSSPSYAQLNIPQIVLVVDGNTFLSKCNFFQS
jgi:hypothetical protein